MREQGSGESRVSRSALIELVSNDRVVCHLRRELLHTKRGAGFAASISFEKIASDELDKTALLANH